MNALELGPLSIRWYSALLLTGIIVGYYVARPAARRSGIRDVDLQLSLLVGITAGFVGARAYHVIDLWSYYRVFPTEIPAIWHGGLGILGGLLGGLIGLAAVAAWRKLPLLRLLDAWAPSVLLAQAIGRLGNWANQEAFGPPTSLPWGVPIDPVNRPAAWADQPLFHPTFFYEAGLDLVGVVVLLWLRRRQPTPGRVFGAYLVIYGVIRIIIERFRFDTAQIGGLAVGDLFAAVMIISGLILLLSRAAAAPTRQSKAPPR